MSDDDDIGMHGVERQRRIEQGFALFHRRSGNTEIDDIGAQAFSGDFEAEQRPR
jgi:hypothetical protein